MRTEISQARREVNAYFENVGKGKVSAAIEERRKKKQKSDDTGSVIENIASRIKFSYLKLFPRAWKTVWNLRML